MILGARHSELNDGKAFPKLNLLLIREASRSQDRRGPVLMKCDATYRLQGRILKTDAAGPAKRWCLATKPYNVPYQNTTVLLLLICSCMHCVNFSAL